METENHSLKHFYAESISVQFDSPPTYTKKPPCPDRFTWQGQVYTITDCLSEWKDFSRRGRMSRNMQLGHAQIASKRGSWGVGRTYFDVQTQSGRRFRLYYDRAPKDALDREGKWILMAELIKKEE